MFEDLALPAQHGGSVIDEPLIQELPDLPRGALVGWTDGTARIGQVRDARSAQGFPEDGTYDEAPNRAETFALMNPERA